MKTLIHEVQYNAAGYRKSDTRGKALNLFCEIFPLRMSNGILTLLPRMFRGFLQSIQANVAIVP